MSNINFLSKILYSLREENYKNCIKYTYSTVMNRYITGRRKWKTKSPLCIAENRAGLYATQILALLQRSPAFQPTKPLFNTQAKRLP